MLKAAIANLWFVMIHPFDDHNGRMAPGHYQYVEVLSRFNQ
ncbi:Fic family protein [Mucilaginibacter sp. SG538B]